MSDGISALKSITMNSHSAPMRWHISRARSGSTPTSVPLVVDHAEGRIDAFVAEFEVFGASGRHDADTGK